MTESDYGVMQQALDALLGYKPQSLTHAKEQGMAIIALREAIAQPVQPAAPVTQAVPLTRSQIQTIVIEVCDQIYPQDNASYSEADTVFYGAFAHAIEAAHGIQGAQA